MNQIVTEIISDANGVLEKIASAQLGLPAGFVDPILVKAEAGLEAALSHLGKHPSLAAPVAAASTDASAGSAKEAATVSGIALAFLVTMLATMGFFAGCGTIDPPLPGAATPAPFLAFTNGNAYILGHAATSNQVYTAALDGTKLGVEALLSAAPTATNYLADAQAVFESLATGGTFNTAALTTSLNAIAPKVAEDAALIGTLASTGLSLAGAYVTPLISSDTNSAPFVKAALLGIGAGL